MAAIPDTGAALTWASIRHHAAEFVTTEYASLDRSGAPITWPVTPYLGTNGHTIDVNNGLTNPLKAERARDAEQTLKRQAGRSVNDIDAGRWAHPKARTSL